MSIYATLWRLRFPATGDEFAGCNWVDVLAQGVPAHIGSPSEGSGYEDGDPYAGFLPPAIPVNDQAADGLRAVVIIRGGTEKIGQEYVDPLLVMSGSEYADLPFQDLHDRICDRLRGDHPRIVAEVFGGDGTHQLVRSDGSSNDLLQPGRTREVRAKLTELGIDEKAIQKAVRSTRRR